VASIAIPDEMSAAPDPATSASVRIVLVKCQSERFERIVADCQWLAMPVQEGWFGDRAALQIAEDGSLQQVYPVWVENRGPKASASALVPRGFAGPDSPPGRLMDPDGLTAFLATLRRGGIRRVKLAICTDTDRYPATPTDYWVEDNGLSPLAPVSSLAALSQCVPENLAETKASLVLETGASTLTLLDVAGVISASDAR
jgi:hypothetical protein